MNNYIQDGEALPLVAPYQRNSGEGALIGAIFGVAKNTVPNGALGEFQIEGVVDVATLSTQVIALGAKVYWDDANKRCTGVASGNTLIGAAARAKANAELTTRVYLDGAVR